jgi:hypothetical protein
MIDQQQQVNVPELQRLNEAILLTMDAIRRVAPHLAQVQFPFMGIGAPIDPITASYLQQLAQQHALRAIYAQQIGQWQTPWAQPFGQQQWGQQWPSFGQHPLQQLMQQHPYQQHLLGQIPFGQQLFGQQPFAQPFAQPFGMGGQFSVGQYPQTQQLFGQQPFGFGQQYGSPVNYGAQRPF